MLSIIGIIVGLAAFIFLAFKGYNTIFVAVISAIVVALFGGLNPFTALTDSFMTSASGFLKGYLVLFLFSGLFAKVMGDSAAAASIAVKVARIARRAKNPLTAKFLAVASIPCIQIILTYGGVNVFVTVFIMVSLARALFKDLDIPWWLYTCSSLGSSTLTIGMLPGSPQFQNIIPTQYLGTTTMAAPGLGIFCAILALILGMGYIFFQVRRAHRRGEGFMPTGTEISKETLVEPTVENEKPIWACLIPMIVVIVMLNVVKLTAEMSLCCGIVVGYVLFSIIEKKPMNIKSLLAGSIPMAIMPLVTVCCASGFGGVVGAVPGFENIVSGLMHLGVNAFTIVLICNVCSAICGSASSGENIAFQNFGDLFQATGIPAEYLHRLVTISSIGLDDLPHSSGVITSLSTTKLTHKQAYVNIFFLSIVNTTIVSLVAATLISLGIYF